MPPKKIRNKNLPQTAQGKPPTQNQQLTVTSTTGPLPSPEILERYDAIIKDGANRIMQMAEEQSKHRRERETDYLKAQIRDSMTGIICALVVALAGFAVSAWALYLKEPLAAGMIGAADLGALVSVFIYGTSKKKKQ